MVLWTGAASLIFGTFHWLGIGAAILTSGLGLLLTHYFRRVMQRGGWKELPPARLAPRVLAAAAGIGIVLGLLSAPFFFPLIPEEVRRLHVLISNVVSCSFLVLGWFLIYFCYHFFHRSREAAAKEWQLRAAMRDSELRTLRTQLNPHFLFNSLNSLRGLIPECPERAQEAVTALAGLLRHTLRLSASPTVPLGQELEAARHYLALEQIRFEERLNYRIEVEDGLLAQPVPPMLLQNLLENALKHGIAQRPRGGWVTIEARGSGGMMQLRVTNPGTISAASDHGGLGLTNAREQLRLLYGEVASLELRSDGPDQVVCEVTLPRGKGGDGAAGEAARSAGALSVPSNRRREPVREARG